MSVVRFSFLVQASSQPLNEILANVDMEVKKLFNRGNVHTNVSCFWNLIYPDNKPLSFINWPPKFPLILNGSLWSLYGYSNEEEVRLRDIATVPRYTTDCQLSLYLLQKSSPAERHDLDWLNKTLEVKLDETRKSVSPQFHVIVAICGKPFLNNIMDSLRRKANFILGINVGCDDAVTSIVTMNCAGQLSELLPVGRCSPTSQPCEMFRRLEEISNLHGRELIAVSASGMESVISQWAENGNKKWRGIFYHFFMTIQKKFNCTIEINLVSRPWLDQLWGKPWGPFIETLRKNMFDIAIDAEQDYLREKVATFSIPIIYEINVFVLRAQVAYSTWTIVSQPFTASVWVLTVVSASVFVFISIITLRPKQMVSSFSFSIFFVLRLLLQNQVERRVTTRRIIGIGLTFSCIMCIAYTSKLVSYLTKPHYTHPTTFSELIHNPSYNIYMHVVESPSQQMLFKSYPKMRSRISHVNSTHECITKLLNDSRGACIASDFNAVVEMAANLTPSMESRLRSKEIGGSHLYINWKEVSQNMSRSIGVYYNLKLPYSDEFNRVGRIWSDLGLFTKWINDDLQEVHKYHSNRRLNDTLHGNTQESEKLREIYVGQGKVLKLQNFKGVFIVYAFGVTLCLISILFELSVFYVGKFFLPARYDSDSGLVSTDAGSICGSIDTV